jgi:hypothetical protein
VGVIVSMVCQFYGECTGGVMGCEAGSLISYLAVCCWQHGNLRKYGRGVETRFLGYI